ncbi:MAG TPA: beta-propeller fold lactonase family protein [Solirubrobacterales bacterium]|nr:beta-propeller fold lactonase family protein [Solirubrobacterales bacterium]
MHRCLFRQALLSLFALGAVAALCLPAAAVAGPEKSQSKHRTPRALIKRGTLKQLPGQRGCLATRPAKGSCAPARGLRGAGPFMGSRAIAVSPDGRNVYVAASRSDAIAVFSRERGTGALTQPRGSAGCVAAQGAEGCGRAIGLDGPNSVAVSPDGRFLYATARDSASVAVFHRDRSSGALRQLPPGSGCVSGLPIPGCAPGRALSGPDVVVVSPDGENLYVGSFFGNAVATFVRAKNGALYQAAGTEGCIAEAIAGCATGIALGAPEGLAISPDGTSLYVGSALSNAVAVLNRDAAAGGVLSQATGGSGCVADQALAGCSGGVQLAGANAVAISPAGRDVYVTSLLSNSVTAFSRSAAGVLTQKPGTAACLIFLRAAGCSFGRAMVGPEGIAVSPDGASVYVASFRSGAIDVLDRERESGVVRQKPGKPGCLAPAKVPDCTRGRALAGVSSIAVSPDGRNVYSTAFAGNAVAVFRRIR